MAEKVAEWPKLYNCDGINLDLEDGAGNRFKFNQIFLQIIFGSLVSLKELNDMKKLIIHSTLEKYRRLSNRVIGLRNQNAISFQKV